MAGVFAAIALRSSTRQPHSCGQLLQRLRQGSGECLGLDHRLVLVGLARTGFGHQVGELLLLQAIDLRHIDHTDPVGR